MLALRCSLPLLAASMVPLPCRMLLRKESRRSSASALSTEQDKHAVREWRAARPSASTRSLAVWNTCQGGIPWLLRWACTRWGPTHPLPFFLGSEGYVLEKVWGTAMIAKTPNLVSFSLVQQVFVPIGMTHTSCRNKLPTLNWGYCNLILSPFRYLYF